MVVIGSSDPSFSLLLLLTLLLSNHEVRQIFPFKQTVDLHAPKNSMFHLRLQVLYKY